MLANFDWGNPADCGVYIFLLVFSLLLPIHSCSPMKIKRMLMKIDYKIYEKLVDVTHRYPQIFYDTGDAY